MMRTQYEWLFINMTVTNKTVNMFGLKQDVLIYTVSDTGYRTGFEAGMVATFFYYCILDGPANINKEKTVPIKMCSFSLVQRLTQLQTVFLFTGQVELCLQYRILSQKMLTFDSRNMSDSVTVSTLL